MPVCLPSTPNQELAKFNLRAQLGSVRVEKVYIAILQEFLCQCTSCTDPDLFATHTSVLNVEDKGGISHFTEDLQF